MTTDASTIDQVNETEELSAYDRKLLKAVVASNATLVIQVKQNRISVSKLVMNGMNRLIELAMLVAVSFGGLQLYSTLEKGQQQELASKALHTGVPALLAIGIGKTRMNNKKDNDDLSQELETDSIDVDSLLKELLGEDAPKELK